jgi:hypothetical protein
MGVAFPFAAETEEQGRKEIKRKQQRRAERKQALRYVSLTCLQALMR